MKEGWTSLPLAMRQELLPMDWNGIIGRWNPHKRRRLGFDHKRLWEMIDQKLPELSKMIQELLNGT